jgi:curli biogenesis system outer membrane secretion channel CsgG
MKIPTLCSLALCTTLFACGGSGNKPLTSAAAPTPPVPASTASAPAPAQAASVAAAPEPQPMVRGLDVGKATTQPTRAAGVGRSMSQAVNEAIRSAILQANGTTVDLNSQQFRFALDVATDVGDIGVRAAGFASMVEQRSRGAITGFKLESVEGPDSQGNYKVWIEAQVAKYSPPEAEGKKIKLLVAPIRFDVQSFSVAGRTIPATTVAQDIRNKIQESLVQSGRFAVVDRQFNAEIDQELDMVESGATPNSQFGKLGQTFSADLIWIGRIHALGYVRHTQQLRMSDRSLVSYSGGWAFSQRLVNVATRQVMFSNSLHDKMPGTAPTTLGVSVHSGSTLAAMSNSIVQQVLKSIMASSFPISVVSREGNNVILSQGANALKTGLRYQVIALGAELKDPQTGQSLGRTEANCCEVVVDRVAPTLSYGHLEHVNIPLETVPAGGLLVREAVGSATPQASTPSGAAKPRTRHASAHSSVPEPLAKPKRNEADW